MTKNETYEQRYDRARNRVYELRSFYNHLIVYFIVNAGLAGLNYYSNGWRQLWFIFPLLGWGIGLFVHGLSTFGLKNITGRAWEERKIKEIMEKEQQNTLR